MKFFYRLFGYYLHIFYILGLIYMILWILYKNLFSSCYTMKFFATVDSSIMGLVTWNFLKTAFGNCVKESVILII